MEAGAFGDAAGDGVGAVINRPGNAGRRPRGAGFRQGGLSSGMHPPFSFPSCGKENGPCTVQKKRPLRRAPVQWPSARDGGRRIGACSDLDWSSGTLGSSARSMLPSRGGWCGGRRGGYRIASAPIFAAAGCPARELVRRADVGIRPYKAECNPSLRRGRPACRPLRERQPQRRGRCPHRPESTSPHDRQGSAQQLRSRWRLCRLRLRRAPCG